MREPIAIAGAGRIAQALGRLLRERGEPVVAVASRNMEHAAAAAAFVGATTRAVAYRDLPPHAARILIAVPDDAITDVAGELAAGGMHRGVALHTSGVHGAEALAPLAAAGVACGALHPLQTVANPAEGVRVLTGVAFAIDGAGEAAVWAEHLASLLNGFALHIPAVSRPIYHAAAVMASNYPIALFAMAVMLMREAGVDEASARRALGPLARASIENASRLGPEAALTGPIARGDAGTVRGHLAAMEQVSPAAAGLYRAAGLATLEIARRQGLHEAQADAIEKLLQKG